MNRHIPEQLRLEVLKRAEFRCEYCRMPQQYSLFPFQIDHVVSLKHEGKTTFDNLAFACSFCNINKGSDLGTFLDDQTQLVRFYNPRIDHWRDHFTFDEGAIYPLSDIGIATLKIYKFNDANRVIERRLLAQAGLYDL